MSLWHQLPKVREEYLETRSSNPLNHLLLAHAHCQTEQSFTQSTQRPLHTMSSPQRPVATITSTQFAGTPGSVPSGYVGTGGGGAAAAPDVFRFPISDHARCRPDPPEADETPRRGDTRFQATTNLYLWAFYGRLFSLRVYQQALKAWSRRVW